MLVSRSDLEILIANGDETFLHSVIENLFPQMIGQLDAHGHSLEAIFARYGRLDALKQLRKNLAHWPSETIKKIHQQGLIQAVLFNRREVVQYYLDNKLVEFPNKSFEIFYLGNQKGFEFFQSTYAKNENADKAKNPLIQKDPLGYQLLHYAMVGGNREMAKWAFEHTPPESYDITELLTLTLTSQQPDMAAIFMPALVEKINEKGNNVLKKYENLPGFLSNILEAARAYSQHPADIMKQMVNTIPDNYHRVNWFRAILEIAIESELDIEFISLVNEGVDQEETMPELAYWAADMLEKANDFDVEKVNTLDFCVGAFAEVIETKPALLYWLIYNFLSMDEDKKTDDRKPIIKCLRDRVSRQAREAAIMEANTSEKKVIPRIKDACLTVLANGIAAKLPRYSELFTVQMFELSKRKAPLSDYKVLWEKIKDKLVSVGDDIDFYYGANLAFLVGDYPSAFDFYEKGRKAKPLDHMMRIALILFKEFNINVSPAYIQLCLNNMSLFCDSYVGISSIITHSLSFIEAVEKRKESLKTIFEKINNLEYSVFKLRDNNELKRSNNINHLSQIIFDIQKMLAKIISRDAERKNNCLTSNIKFTGMIEVLLRDYVVDAATAFGIKTDNLPIVRHLNKEIEAMGIKNTDIKAKPKKQRRVEEIVETVKPSPKVRNEAASEELKKRAELNAKAKVLAARTANINKKENHKVKSVESHAIKMEIEGQEKKLKEALDAKKKQEKEEQSYLAIVAEEKAKQKKEEKKEKEKLRKVQRERREVVVQKEEAPAEEEKLIVATSAPVISEKKEPASSRVIAIPAESPEKPVINNSFIKVFAKKKPAPPTRILQRVAVPVPVNVIPVNPIYACAYSVGLPRAAAIIFDKLPGSRLFGGAWRDFHNLKDTFRDLDILAFTNEQHILSIFPGYTFQRFGWDSYCSLRFTLDGMSIDITLKRRKPWMSIADQAAEESNKRDFTCNAGDLEIKTDGSLESNDYHNGRYHSSINLLELVNAPHAFEVFFRHPERILRRMSRELDDGMMPSDITKQEHARVLRNLPRFIESCKRFSVRMKRQLDKLIDLHGEAKVYRFLRDKSLLDPLQKAGILSELQLLAMLTSHIKERSNRKMASVKVSNTGLFRARASNNTPESSNQPLGIHWPKLSE